MKIKAIGMVALCIMLLSGTGHSARDRISLQKKAGEYSEADIEKEIFFGREMSALMLAKHRFRDDQALNRYLNLVGQSIVRHSNRPELNFYFVAIESPQINAYAVPGGYIFVTTAAIDLMQNEAELAGVLAHEIAHVTERHIVEVLKIRADDESMIAIVGKILSKQSASANVVFYQAINHAFDLLFSKGLAAEDEYEADMQGIFLTAFAGYDASAYYQYLDRIFAVISSSEGKGNRAYPPWSERVSSRESLVENNGLTGQGNIKNEKRFASFKP